jgi:hypothetical protein
VWQDLRTELYPALEIVTVGIDTAGVEACRPFIEAAAPQHPGLQQPSLIDANHRVAELFGVINIPNGVWIDENGMIVRPAEAAPAPTRAPRAEFPSEVPDRMVAIFTEAMKIQVDAAGYHDALRDWVANGAASRFALPPDEVVARSTPRNTDVALGQTHFELATHLEQKGRHDLAVPHFREAHRLQPDNFSYRRQAWSLERADGAFDRFWQGPLPGKEADWPYDGDWLTDVTAMGAENYYPAWRP